MKENYSANACMVVRRASDSTTSEIGFDGDVIDVATLATFCSGTTCTVDTWYDQGVGGLDLTYNLARKSIKKLER